MADKLNYKIDEMTKAIDNFSQSLAIDKSVLSESVIDSVESGQIQKFEFCTELIWKLIKKYLFIVEGIDCKSPKQVIKEYFTLNNVDYDDYETLIQMIDDRNHLSHIYKEEAFNLILNRLVKYADIMKIVLTNIIRKYDEFCSYENN